jgi:MFS family permease
MHLYNQKIANSNWQPVLQAAIAAFCVYGAMYAFRKPFAAATFEGLTLGGMQYKIVLILSQAMGYLTSKFIGIRFISALKPEKRYKTLLFLIGMAWLSLLFFALTPYPFNFVWMFFNGLPLGMVFGIVFSYLEGRRVTELLGIGLGISIIFASGAVKSVGKTLLDDYSISVWWMPFVAGLLFLPVFLISSYFLTKLPPPDAEDIRQRNVRLPMTEAQRKTLFWNYAPGICLLTFVYICLTAFRDLRDNFAVEIWAAVGFGGKSGILLSSEWVISLAVLLVVAGLFFIKDNRKAFFTLQILILIGGFILGFSTFLFQKNLIGAQFWMISSGFGLFLGYTVFQGFLFERMMATYKEPGNVGFLMYFADSFGYLGSVLVLLWRNFMFSSVDWLAFFCRSAYVFSGFILVAGLGSVFYFSSEKRTQIVRVGQI